MMSERIDLVREGCVETERRDAESGRKGNLNLILGDFLFILIFTYFPKVKGTLFVDCCFSGGARRRRTMEIVRPIMNLFYCFLMGISLPFFGSFEYYLATFFYYSFDRVLIFILHRGFFEKDYF